MTKTALHKNAYFRLMRLHRPVGVYLVMWPVLIGLVDAFHGKPGVWLVAAFVLGAVLSRSAGCIANDVWDRKFDTQVTRTKARPLATGELAPRRALALMLALLACCALLAWLISPLVLAIALLAVPLILLYPLAKRVTGHPQVMLALTFSMGIPMAYASAGQLTNQAWLLLMLANMAWIYAYDTIYAMADKQDDIRLGIGSSALSWGNLDWMAVAVVQLLTLGLLCWWWRSGNHGPFSLLALGLCALGFVYQQWVIRKRGIDRCVGAFRSNHWLQAVILLGLTLDYGLGLSL